VPALVRLRCPHHPVHPSDFFLLHQYSHKLINTTQCCYCGRYRDCANVRMCDMSLSVSVSMSVFMSVYVSLCAYGVTHVQIYCKLSQSLPTSNFQSTCRGTSCRPRCYFVGHIGRRRVGRKRQTRGRRRQYKGGGARGRVRQQVQTSCTLGATAFELRALCTGESRWPF